MRNKVAITGASSGIGAAFARKLAPEHDLILIARRKDRLEQLAAELKADYEANCEVIEADLSCETNCEEVANRLAAEPDLALLVNNAGFGTKGYFWKADYAGQKQMHDVHVMATLRLTHAVLGNMVARDFGAIINVASVASFVRGAGAASYNATKSWMTSFTEALYLELKSAGSSVRVQALCPGFTYSEFHDRLAIARSAMAPPSFWHTAEDIVGQSLAGLERNKLFVIPGWRYKLLVGLVSRVPTGVRLAIESASGERRKRALEEHKKTLR